MSFVMIVIIVGYAGWVITGLTAYIFFMLWRNKSNKKIEEDNSKIMQLNIDKSKLQKDKDVINEKIKRSISIDDIFDVFNELQNN